MESIHLCTIELLSVVLYSWQAISPVLSLQVCAICGDPFEQFWDEDQEAWHLKDAIRVHGEV